MPLARCHVMWKVVFPKLCFCLIKTCWHVDVTLRLAEQCSRETIITTKMKYNFLFQFISKSNKSIDEDSNSVFFLDEIVRNFLTFSKKIFSGLDNHGHYFKKVKNR